MREAIRKPLCKVRLDGVAKRSLHALRQSSRRIRRVDDQLVTNYLAKAPIRKLQIGCGSNPLPGWLNTDFYPYSEQHVHLDATKAFPLPDEAFDFVFSEHMIEHIPFQDAFTMLKECHRVLKPGGVVRIVTPDLQFLWRLYEPSRSELEARYIDWSLDTYDLPKVSNQAAIVINNFVRDWGHLFIYDEETLQALFQRTGFTTCVRAVLGQSDHPELRDLEHVARMPPGFLSLESLALEGVKGR